jgi:hypothetical protein
MPDRIEREIEEILRKLDKVTPQQARRQARRVGQPFGAAQSWLAHRLARVSLNQVMVWSLLTFIIAFFLRGIPGASWIMIGALIVFGTSFLLSKAFTSQTQSQKRWRGQPMDLSGPNWPNRLKAWLKGRRRV